MKTLYPLLAFVACILLLPAAQAQADKNYVYTIHVGAYINPRPADFDPLQPLGFLYGKSFDNNLLRIYLGDFRQESDARRTLASVKNKGFSDAYITKLPANQGKQVPVIQVATRLASENVDWDRFISNMPVQVLSLDGALKIAFGPYATSEAAAQQLSRVRSSGFSDAFVKVVDEQLLHPITLYQVKNEMVENGTAKPTPEDVPSSYDVTSAPVTEVLTEKTVRPNTPPPAEPIPASYDEVMTLKSPSKTIALPAIRTKVKRNSAFELQKVLKQEGVYASSLDGYYGKGTAAGFEKFKKQNRQMVKYGILADNTSRPKIKAQKGSLQHTINTLADNTPQAVISLEQSNEAIAKAYRAYIYFRTSGPSARVDQLMNDAVKQAFSGKGIKNKPPFDYRSTYTYKDLKRLIQHLRYIQDVDPNGIAVPCWLFSTHPEEAASAFESGAYFSENNYAIEACDEMINWEELQLLETIAEDLNPTGQVDKKALQQNAFKRSRLLLLNRALTTESAAATENWHQTLWKGLDAWSQSDLLHQKMVLPFRVAYFQSLVRLEDYYMNKGQKPREARQLALATLRTFAEPHLSDYMSR